MTTATAQAFANIVFIKYWGNRDNTLRLPSNGSISMNLDRLYTRMTVSFKPSLPYGELVINGQETTGEDRDLIHGMANITERLRDYASRALIRSGPQGSIVPSYCFTPMK
jgi:diphosphomevalonate decarboxylase